MWSTGLQWTKCCKVSTHVELQCINFVFIKSLEFYTFSGHLCSINSCVYAAAIPVVPSTASVTSVSPSLCSRPCQLRDCRYSAARRGTHTRSSSFLTYFMLHVDCPISLPAEEWRATSILDLGTIALVWVSAPQTTVIHVVIQSQAAPLTNYGSDMVKNSNLSLHHHLVGTTATLHWSANTLVPAIQKPFYMLHPDETIPPLWTIELHVYILYCSWCKPLSWCLPPLPHEMYLLHVMGWR